MTEPIVGLPDRPALPEPVLGPFVPTSKRTWSLGSFDAPDLSFNGRDGYGVEWIIRDPAGWYRSPPVELGLEDKPTDGSWFGRGSYRARVVEISGAFRVCSGGIDELEETAERLQDALHPSIDTLLSVTEPIPKQLTVRPSSEVSIDPVPGQTRARTFSFVLTAADPFKYAAGSDGLESVPLVLRDPASSRGATHPMTHPLDHGGAPPTIGGRATVRNIGKLPVAPRIVIDGPVASPTLSNVTTGQAFTLARDLVLGEQAVIDMNLRTVRINGVSSYRSKAPRSRFWALAKGPNDVRFEAAVYNPAASARIEFRPRWK